MQEEITSPPYPKAQVTIKGLYTCVIELTDWVNQQRDWFNVQADRLNAPEDQYRLKSKLPTPTDWSFQHNFQQLPVNYLYNTFMALRHIRETYDELVRNYETLEDWSSDICTVRRITLIKVAADLVSFVCLDKEKREAFLHERDKVGFKRFKEMIRQLTSNDSSSDFDDDDDDDDLDRLFNPEQ